MASGETTRLDSATGPRLRIGLDMPLAPAPIRITLAGELDGEEVPALQAALAGVLLRGPRHLCVEAAELTFLDSAGIRALLIFRESADEIGSRVVIGPVTPNVYLVLKICGLLEVFGVDDPARPA